MGLLKRQSKVSRLCAVNGDFTETSSGHNTVHIPEEHMSNKLLIKSVWWELTSVIGSTHSAKQAIYAKQVMI
jgi:hypothetical protein